MRKMKKLWTIRPWFLAFLICAAVTSALNADTITVGGTISQSVEDGTGPAANNPDLNLIMDGDAYTIQLSFLGNVSGPGTHALEDVILSFSTARNGLVENEFDSASLTVTQAGNSDLVSIFACLQTGSGCNQGNELDLNFVVPVAGLNAAGVMPANVDGLLPFDLLEDDGVTDIHGSIGSYSYSPPSSTPPPISEPSGIVTLAVGAVALAVAHSRLK
jgi:hypothetical protein